MASVISFPVERPGIKWVNLFELLRLAKVKYQHWTLSLLYLRKPAHRCREALKTDKSQDINFLYGNQEKELMIKKISIRVQSSSGLVRHFVDKIFWKTSSPSALSLSVRPWWRTSEASEPSFRKLSVKNEKLDTFWPA